MKKNLKLLNQMQNLLWMEKEEKPSENQVDLSAKEGLKRHQDLREKKGVKMRKNGNKERKIKEIQHQERNSLR